MDEDDLGPFVDHREISLEHWQRAFLAALLATGARYSRAYKDGVWVHTFDNSLPPMVPLPTPTPAADDIAREAEMCANYYVPEESR